MTPRTKVGFLYNHDAGHQVRHSAAVIPALLAGHPAIEITVLATSDARLEAVRGVSGTEAGKRCKFVRLDIPAWHKPIAQLLDTVMPFSRLDHLYSNRAVFAFLDAVVVTEGTSLFLRKLRGLDHLKILRIDHGAGDRSIGFQPSFVGNDLVLLPGAKQRQRFLQLGYLRPEQIAVVGYPKFDAVNLAAGRHRKFFADDKPVVLYNPHPEPRMSSWYDMGLNVLEYFAGSTDYNLIFAPHVMLFKRRLHATLEGLAVRWRGDVPEKYRRCSNIRIDTGSAACLDMTYTLAADIYLGDVSSQIYEFLIEPRPCIFLNPRRAQWQDDPNYAFWHFGPVVSDIKRLDHALRRALRDHAVYSAIQQQAFQSTFDLQTVPSAVRAAEAIAGFLAQGRIRLNQPDP
ncbi:MAG: hypothetical protein EXQ84_07930 [Rhodospirillaceae bacterium]|nr:hypothetical protein [Rhodospirillaceae bacterium]